MVLVTVLLPYTPLGRSPGFQATAAAVLAAVAAIVATYVASAELVKRWFYRHYGM